MAHAIGETSDLHATQTSAHEAALLALSGELLAHVGLDGTVSGANRAWTEALGDAAWPDAVHPADREAAAAFPETLACRMLGTDGEVRVAWRFAEVEDGFLAAGRDLTPVVRAQAELQDFAYVASHDLAEPLRMVTSYLQLLQRRYGGQLDEAADEFIGYAIGGATRMGALIDGLLAFSRVATHELELADVDLASVAAPLMPANGSAPQALPRITADPTLLVRLLGELEANARRFGATSVSLSAEPAGEGVRIAVADDGKGIAAADHGRIFQPFMTLHGREEHPGVGMGLAVCRRIAERHGGEIGVESELGHGSTFWVWLPR